MAQLRETTIDGKLTILNNNIHLDNGNVLYGLNADGADRAMVQINTNNEMFFGYGGYKNNEGKSYFDGNEVNIRSKGGIYITDPDAGLNARAYGQNKVLWTGSWYMSSGHTANLSEAVSAQPHGIVLVWSVYNNGAVENSNFSYVFVPKQHITSFAGSGVSMTIFNSNWSKAACKYLYINNTTITGHDNNTLANTGATGVVYTNNYWVLRQVIGV